MIRSFNHKREIRIMWSDRGVSSHQWWIDTVLHVIWASQVALVVKDLPANAGDLRDTGSIPGSGRSPGGEGMATHSSILAWRIPWTEEPGGLQSIGSQKVGHDWSDLACTHQLYLNISEYSETWKMTQPGLVTCPILAQEESTMTPGSGLGCLPWTGQVPAFTVLCEAMS